MRHQEGRQPGNALPEARFAILAAGNLRKRTLPPARRFRRCNLWRHSLDELHALGRCNQIFAAAANIANLQQPLDDRSARGRRAQRTVLHRLAQRLILDLTACMLHLAKQRSVVMLLGRLGLLFPGLCALAQSGITLRKRRQLLLIFRFLFLFHLLAVDFLPTLLRNALAGGEKIILTHACHHAQRVILVIGIECRSQPARDHLIEIALIRRKRQLVRPLASGDDRVVIGELRIVKHARRHANAKGKRLFADRLQIPGIGGKRLFHLAGHVPREIPAIRSGIGDQLMVLVKLLRGGKRLFRREAKLPVCLALQGRQVVEQRRILRLLFPRRLRDDALLSLDARCDLLRQFAAVDALFALGRYIRAMIGAKVRADGIIRLRNERIDLFSALDKHGKRRRLHTAHGQKHVIAQRVGARGVHADEPVSVCAAARAGIKRIIIRRRTQVVKALADRLIGH